MKYLIYVLKRNYHNKKTNLVICLFILWPIIELLILTFKAFKSEGNYLSPDQIAMICNAGQGMSFLTSDIFGSVFLFVIPFVLLIINTDDITLDYTSHMDNIFKTKVGNRNYIIIHLIKSILMTSTLVIFSFGMNLILSHLLFNGASNTPYSKDLYNINAYWTWMLAHPTLTNIIFIIINAILYSCISLVGTSFAFIFKKKKYIYAATMFIWCMWLYMPCSINLISKSFVFVDLKTQILSLVCVLITTFVTLIFLVERVFLHEKTSI